MAARVKLEPAQLENAVEQSASGLLMPALPRALPNLKALIIGCADMRVDPVHVLVSGLEKLS
jgi:carbonic anhydrase